MNTFTDKYLELLKNDFSYINLTRIMDVNEFYEKQYLDSVYPFKQFKILDDGFDAVVDIGFGGGFPSLPLADRYSDIKFFGIDARAKKVKAVNEIAKIMNIKNFKGFHGRVENFYLDLKSLVTFKAVGEIGKCLRMLNLNKGSLVCFYKGPNVELDEDLDASSLDYDLIKFEKYKIGNNDRAFLVYKKVNNKLKLNKNIVNLTTLIS